MTTFPQKRYQRWQGLIKIGKPNMFFPTPLLIPPICFRLYLVTLGGEVPQRELYQQDQFATKTIESSHAPRHSLVIPQGDTNPYCMWKTATHETVGSKQQTECLKPSPSTAGSGARALTRSPHHKNKHTLTHITRARRDGAAHTMKHKK